MQVMMPSTDLKGKKAVVTGAGKGIGRGIALAYAEMGADVALVSRTESDLKKVAAEIEAMDRQALVVPADVSKVAEIRRMTAEVMDAFGRIDILVNNAGRNILSPALEVTEEDWDKVLELNLKGLFFCCQAVGKYMVRQRKGKIINITSQMGVVALPNRVTYCASKGGVVQLTKVLALEWAQYNVNVNAIGPTFIKTPLTEPILANEEFRQEVLWRIPMGRVGEVRDVVGAAVFLASDASDFITGHTLLVDGGWVAH